jgi:Uma2 family endonuclease
MSAAVLEGPAQIPKEVVDLSSFRRWARSSHFPRRGRFSFLDGKLWVDMSPEELYSHNQAKGEISIVVGALVKKLRLGRFFHDRTLLSHVRAGLSTEPDGVFLSWDAWESRRIRLVRGSEGYMELKGTPDMTLEVVSKSSVRKDTVVLRRLYWQAGIPEYWLVDARGEKPSFEILRCARSGYVESPRRSGWQRSSVFGKSFKLSRSLDKLGYPEYTLSVR